MTDLIDELRALDDAELSKRVGLDKELAQAREGLDKMAALEGDARKEALERVTRMFEPHVYAGEFKWIADDAKRAATLKAKGADAMGCCCPAEMVD